MPAATPTALITLHNPSDDHTGTLDTSFRKTLSTNQRVIAVIALANKSPFAGFPAVTSHRQIRPVFQPQRCTLTDPDTGLELEFLLGMAARNLDLFTRSTLPSKLPAPSGALSTLLPMASLSALVLAPPSRLPTPQGDPQAWT
jgi:hypothetical protein